MKTFVSENHKKNKNSLPGLRVEVWERHMAMDKLVGVTLTDREGLFAFPLSMALTPKLRQAKNTRIYYKIIYRGKLLLQTPPNGSNNGNPGAPVNLYLELPGPDDAPWIQWLSIKCLPYYNFLICQ